MSQDLTWIDCTVRMPRKNETCNGRVAALDEDGYAVIALYLPANKSLIANGLRVTHWSPLPPALSVKFKPMEPL